MAKSTKRKKKSNIHLRHRRIAEASFNKYVIAYATNQGMKETSLIKMPGAKIVKPTLFEAQTLTENRFHWTMHLAGFGRKENGLEYMEYEVIKTSAPYLQRDLVHYLNDRHQEFLRQMNDSRRVGAGWVATMSGREMTEYELKEIFNRLNAWG